MGIHRKVTGQGSGGAGDPVVLPPSKGIIKDDCDGIAQAKLIFDITPPKNAKEEEENSEVKDTLANGNEITIYTWDDSSGDSFPKGTTTPEITSAQSQKTTPDVLIDDKPNVKAYTGIPIEGDIEDLKKGRVRTVVVEPPKKMTKREDYEIKEVKRRVNGKVVQIEVKAENKKEKLLEKKINQRYGEELLP